MTTTRAVRLAVCWTVLCMAIPGAAQVQTYCTKIGDNISCTTYDRGASSQSYCTSIAGNMSCTTYNDSYDRVQVLRDYQAGEVVGTALGSEVMAAIEQYKAHKRMKQVKDTLWNQAVQDAVATAEVNCEKGADSNVLDCRTETFNFNQFIHRHKKEFIVDKKNLYLLADALEKIQPDDHPGPYSEQTFELAFQSIDKRQLDKKVYLDDGAGPNRVEW